MLVYPVAGEKYRNALVLSRLFQYPVGLIASRVRSWEVIASGVASFTTGK